MSGIRGRQGSRRLRRPEPLRPGDRVAVVAPGAVSDRKAVSAGVGVLRDLGYRVEVASNTSTRNGYLAGSDASRAESLRAALLDDEIRGLFVTRGGYGSARLLPLVEEAFRRARPKLLVGYSDATALLAHVTGRLGWTAFHGPMVAADLGTLGPGALRNFADTVAGRDGRRFRFRRIHSGVAEGRLLGGCLSILVTLLGTPWAIDTRGAILFLEDVNEKPYRLDRMLTHLSQAGALAGVRGIVFGELPGCGTSRELRRVLSELTRPLGIPVGVGVPSGHGRGKRVLPLGARARLDADAGILEILEPPFAARK